MNIRTLLVTLATFGPVGFLPASGTIASLITLIPVYVSWSVGLYPVLYVVGISLVTVVAYYSIKYVLTLVTQKDPAQIVIDEAVGCLLVFCGIPLTWPILFIGFGLFRLLDIYKPLGIAHFEEYQGARGVLLDDIAAGLLSNIALRFILCYS